MVVILKILLVFSLILLNAFFVASEFSLVTVRKTRIAELVKKGRRRAKLIQNAQNNISRYISATQLGITIASLGLGWIGEPVVADMLQPLFGFLPSKAALITAHAVAIFVALNIITYLHIVLGELTPKKIALQNAEKVSVFIIAPLVLFTQLFRPFIYLLHISGNFIMKVLGLSASQDKHQVHSEEEIKLILDQSQKEGELEKEEAQMLYNVFKLADLPVKKIMVPRNKIILLDEKSTLDDLSKIIKKYHYFSRFPVCRGNIDKVEGFIHIKDFYILSNQPKFTTLKDSGIIRKVLFMSENEKADDVFLEMRRKKIHIAVIRNKNKHTEGVVTMEDIIESLVGEIEDEYDKIQRK